MIVDQYGLPFPEKTIAQRYIEYLERSQRECKATYLLAAARGWTDEQRKQYIETGEVP